MMAVYSMHTTGWKTYFIKDKKLYRLSNIQANFLAHCLLPNNEQKSVLIEDRWKDKGLTKRREGGGGERAERGLVET